MDDFIEAHPMATADMLGEVMRESELSGALNSIELSLDRLYQNINTCACEMARKNIMITSALLKVNIDTLSDSNGPPLLAHASGEAVTLFKCTPVKAQIRHNEKRCCCPFG